MTAQPDFCRDFGILPDGVAPPPGTIRSYLRWYHVIGQYVMTCLISGLGIGGALYFAQTLLFPRDVLAAFVLVAGCGFLVYLAIRKDYLWVELDGETIRGKHLYTGQVIERTIEEIEDLLTLVFLVRNLPTRITEAWLGRVRGIRIRFHDKRTPLQIMRTDPAMKNAKELIEAVLFRMSAKAEIDAEIIDFEGKPLIRRIYWKDVSPQRSR